MAAMTVLYMPGGQSKTSFQRLWVKMVESTKKILKRRQQMVVISGGIVYNST